MTTARTFADLLAERLALEPGRPLLTAYDDSTGERVELSVTTYGNWVSKTANLLTDELGLGVGDTVLLDLPPHWLTPVFVGAAWAAGLAVTTDREIAHQLVVCGPGTMAEHRAASTSGEVLACSLLPFAARFTEALGDGVLDYGLLWPGQSDLFLPMDPVTPDTVAWLAPGSAATQAQLLERTPAASLATGARLLTDLDLAQDQAVPGFLAPLAAGGSVVLLCHADDALWAARERDERVTAVRRAADQPDG